ncbi:MAG: hypothetical protein BroJett030_08550 [Alphaproteobacteria bacterium]|nr:MAG: hypothetical protein BroJett030_08550 [Alphaproteobacteria bacterium]
MAAGGSIGFLAAALALTGQLTGPAMATEPVAVDVELVLAVDISMSMDEDEIGLQRRGYLEAFRSPDLIEAIRSNGLGRIAITYMEWAGIGQIRFVVPWRLIDGPEAMARFADELERAQPGRIDRTSISGALVAASEAFDANGFEGRRRIIDISGDGPNNDGEALPAMRDRLVANGIVINGLALMIKPGSQGFGIDNLDEYYRACVTGGSGSFVLAVRDWRQFPRALKLKLLQEIADPPPEPGPRLHQAQYADDEVDCEIGEKIWRDFIDRFGGRRG